MPNCLFVNFMFTFILMQFLTILKTNSCAETEESLMDDPSATMAMAFLHVLSRPQFTMSMSPTVTPYLVNINITISHTWDVGYTSVSHYTSC